MPKTTAKKSVKSAAPAKEAPRSLVGRTLPNFTLPSEAGDLKLSELVRKKNAVLYFYPRDNTSGCTREACDFAANKSSFESNDTVIIGVSPDTVESHRRFREKHKLNFTLLSDPDAKLAKALGAWGPKVMYGKKFNGIIRSTFLIGKDGVIAKAWTKVKVDGHCDDVLSEAAILCND